MDNQSIAIIGAGIFGISTALAWRKKYPTASVFLVDMKSRDHATGRDQIIPASEDTSKIIRTAYSSPEYAKLAEEALKIWQTDSTYSKYWHKSGWVIANAENVLSITQGTAISQNRFLELFPDSKLNPKYEITENGDPGWVDASEALHGVLETAIAEGVTYVSGEATELLWNDSSCIGIRLDGGREIFAKSTVVATGCWTLSFLERCDVSHGITNNVAGITVVGIQLSKEQYDKYRDMPILAVPGRGEIMPPNRNGIIKINNAISFHAPEIYSRDIGSPYFEENTAMLAEFFPDLQHAQIAFRRYCYDVVTTPTQDFVISAIPNVAGLYVATGGSFHSWKFMPNIGKYVGQMIEGILSPMWSEKWRVNGKPSEQPIHGEITPRRSFM